MKRAAGRLCVFLVTGTWVLPSARAQSRLDSLQRLDEVVIEAQTPVKEVIPAQRLAGDGLQRLGGTQDREHPQHGDEPCGRVL